MNDKPCWKFGRSWTESLLAIQVSSSRKLRINGRTLLTHLLSRKLKSVFRRMNNSEKYKFVLLKEHLKLRREKLFPKIVFKFAIFIFREGMHTGERNCSHVPDLKEICFGNEWINCQHTFRCRYFSNIL